MVGTWQTSRETRALLEIGCGRLRIHKLEGRPPRRALSRSAGAAPFGKGALLYSMELQEIVRRPASFKRSVVKKMGSRACHWVILRGRDLLTTRLERFRGLSRACGALLQ